MNNLLSSSNKLGHRKLVNLVVALLLSVALLTAIAPQQLQAAEAQSSSYSGGHYHWVASGDSLSKLARRYSVTVYQLASANGLGTHDYLYIGQKIYVPAATGTPNGCKWHYTVKHGDTLSHIARYYGVNYAALANANGLYSAHSIYVGQKICIPQIYGTSGYTSTHPSKPHYNQGHHGHHVVAYGETLANIAWHYGTTAYQLAAINNISNVNHIYVGQQLKLTY